MVFCGLISQSFNAIFNRLNPVCVGMAIIGIIIATWLEVSILNPIATDLRYVLNMSNLTLRNNT